MKNRRTASRQLRIKNMRMKKTRTAIVASIIVALTTLVSSCKGCEGEGIEYVPFQETEDGRWGMISPSGKVLFTEEFRSRPTVVRDGRFFVKSDSDMWELYDASEKPKKLGEYVEAAAFHDGVALVTKKGKHVSIIDTEGNVVKELDKIEGKEVQRVWQMSEGYAVFTTTDSLEGVVDKSGKCVIKPEYARLGECHDGKFVGVRAKYKTQYLNGETDKYKVCVIDCSGKQLLELSHSKYEYIAPSFKGGYLVVSERRDEKEEYGLINDKGEYAVGPKAKLNEIGDIAGDCFTYQNGDLWGLMNFQGETLIRAKYDQLEIDNTGRLIAGTTEKGGIRYKYIDKEDRQIGQDTYVNCIASNRFDGEHSFVQVSDDLWAIIDSDGKIMEKLPDMTAISLDEGDAYVESDCEDMQKIVTEFGISDNGAMGLTWKTTPYEAAQTHAGTPESMDAATEEHPAGTAYWYDYVSKIDFKKTVGGVEGTLSAKFSGPMSSQTYTTERVIDRTDGNCYWYHNEQKPTGYVWNDVRIKSFTFGVSNNGRMKGKLRLMYKALYEKFKTMGKVAKENNSAAVINLRNGYRALVAMESTRVWVQWGDLAPVKNIDIERYKDASEDNESEESTPMDAYDYAEAADTVAAIVE